MTLWLIGQFSLTLLGVMLTALFAGIETGCYTLNRIGLAVRVGRRERTAVILDHELSRPDRVIATLLIGNNIAHYLSGVGIATVLEYAGFGPVASVVINLAVLLPVIFILAETLPKDLFRTYTDVWTYRFARYLRTWRWLLTIVPLVPAVTFIADVAKWCVGGQRASLVEPRQRMAQLIREGVHAGVLSEGQTTLVDRALAARGVRVSSQMTAWTKVTFISVEDSPERRRSTIARSGASRFPVVDRAGRVVGVLSALDVILAPDAQTTVLMRPPLVVPPTEATLSVLRTLRARRDQLAIVGDAASGQAVGIVAIKDLVEPISGQVRGAIQQRTGRVSTQRRAQHDRTT